MKNKIKLAILIIVSLFFFVLGTNAQEVQSEFSFGASRDIGDGDYSQYYHFGKISVNLGTDKSTYNPGDEIIFKGDIINQNEYPVFNGKVYVQVFQENKEGQSVNGDNLRSQFFVQDEININSNEQLPFFFKWKIPNSFPEANYKAAFFFLSGNYNMAGLPYLNNIYAGFVNFNTTKKDGENSAQVIIDRNNLKFNGEPYLQRALFPNATSDEEIRIEIPIKNFSDQTKEIKIKKSLYYWDNLNQKNKISENEESVSINPSSTYNYVYNQVDIREPVYYLVFEVLENDSDASSIVDLRFTTDQNYRARINYSGLTKFPLKEGEKAIFFTNFHSTSNMIDSGNKVEIVLRDKDSKVLDTLTYEGDIPENIQLKKKEFQAKSDLDYVTIVSTIKNKDNQIVDDGIIVLDASKLTSYKKTENTLTNSNSLPNKIIQKSPAIKIAIAISLFIILVIVILVILKIRKRNKNNNFPMSAIVFFLVASCSIFSLFLFQKSSNNEGSSWAVAGVSNSGKIELDTFGATIGPWNLKYHAGGGQIANLISNQALNLSYILKADYTKNILTGSSNQNSFEWYQLEGANFKQGDEFTLRLTLDKTNSEWFGTGGAIGSPPLHWKDNGTDKKNKNQFDFDCPLSYNGDFRDKIGFRSTDYRGSVVLSGWTVPIYGALVAENHPMSIFSVDSKVNCSEITLGTGITAQEAIQVKMFACKINGEGLISLDANIGQSRFKQNYGQKLVGCPDYYIGTKYCVFGHYEYFTPGFLLQEGNGACGVAINCNIEDVKWPKMELNGVNSEYLAIPAFSKTYNLNVCSSTSWSPDQSNVCSGKTLTQTSNCNETREVSGTMPSISGQCGSAVDKLWEIKPNSDLCSIGTASDPTSSENQWCWNCSGICGGNTTECCAQRDNNWKEIAP